MAVQFPVQTIKLFPARGDERRGDGEVFAVLAELGCVDHRVRVKVLLDDLLDRRFKGLGVVAHDLEREGAGELDDIWLVGHEE